VRDESLVAQAAGGDRDAFTSLVERYGSRVLAVIEKQVGDHHGALDLAQEVWIKVYAALEDFRHGATFRPWLFAIVFNSIRDDHRNRARRRDRVSEVEPGQWEGAAARGRYDPTATVAELEHIDAALAGVPEPFRAALQLVDALDFSYDEAAQSLDCSEGTVKSRVHRGRIAFRDLYEKLSGGARRSAHPSPSTSSRRALASPGSAPAQEKLES
jgi:RNA polymerase sigma-70 factor (ECF subfamily)